MIESIRSGAPCMQVRNGRGSSPGWDRAITPGGAYTRSFPKSVGYLAVAMFCCSTSFARPVLPLPQEVRIYYVGFHTLYRARQSVESIRSQVTPVVHKDAAGLKSVVDEMHKFDCGEAHRSIDPRLVVDLVYEGGVIQTVAADNSVLDFAGNQCKVSSEWLRSLGVTD